MTTSERIHVNDFDFGAQEIVNIMYVGGHHVNIFGHDVSFSPQHKYILCFTAASDCAKPGFIRKVKKQKKYISLYLYILTSSMYSYLSNDQPQK